MGDSFISVLQNVSDNFAILYDALKRIASNEAYEKYPYGKEMDPDRMGHLRSIAEEALSAVNITEEGCGKPHVQKKKNYNLERRIELALRKNRKIEKESSKTIKCECGFENTLRKLCQKCGLELIKINI